MDEKTLKQLVNILADQTCESCFYSITFENSIFTIYDIKKRRMNEDFYCQLENKKDGISLKIKVDRNDRCNKWKKKS